MHNTINQMAVAVRRKVSGLLAAVLVASGLGLAAPILSASPADAAFSVPQFVRTIGGNGRPGVFPWGIQYNPVSNEILVGDYLNYQIRRYSLDGKILGSFFRSNSTGQPYSLAVNPNNGEIYVPEIADGQTSNKVAVYAADGTYLRQLTLSGVGYQAWIAVDNNNQLYVADSHYYNNNTTNPPRVRVYRTTDGGAVRNWTILPPGTTSTTVPRTYGIGIDPTSGSVWLTDTFNQKLLKYSSTGTFQASYDMSAVVAGDARGMAIDAANNRLYISDSAGGQLEVFNLSGTYLQTLGGPGTGPTQLSSPRQPAIGPNGTVYVAEYGNARVHRYTSTGVDAGYFPDPPQPAVAGQLGEPRDVAVDATTGEVWVADSWNQRFQKFSNDGEFIGTWGNRSSSPTYGMNYPRGIAVDSTNDIVWVANQRGHHIKRFTRQGDFRDMLGNAETDSDATGFFRWPNDIEVDLPRNRVFVSDRGVSNKVKILNAVTGAETGSITRNGNDAVAVDPDTGNIYIADANQSRIYRYDSNGTELGYFGSSGTGDGQFKHIWDMVVSNGMLWVTDDTASRVQAFSLTGTFQGKWGGFGTGAYQFKNPSGIAAGSDGKLYIADSGNDRVVVYDLTKARGGSNWPPPTVTVAAPGNNAALPGQPARLSGTATDETGVAGVEIAVQNTVTGKWFNSGNSTWGDTQSWSESPYWGPVTNVSFAWTFIGVEYSGSYHAEFRAFDASGNISSVVTRDFTILAKSAVDTLAPTSYVSSPSEGEALSNTPPLVLAGQAADDVAVNATQINIRKLGANQWLQPNGTWGAFTWLSATLDDPGSVSTAWRYAWAAPENGDYILQVRSTDVIGNVENPVVQRSFQVGNPDTTAPDATVTLPVTNASYAQGPMTFSGTATDNKGVASVKVTIRNVTSGQWYQANGTWGANAAPLDATLAAPGATSTGWTYAWTPSATGNYAIGVATVDTSGNADATKPWVPFKVVTSVDTVAPTLTVTSPVGPVSGGIL